MITAAPFTTCCRLLRAGLVVAAAFVLVTAAAVPAARAQNGGAGRPKSRSAAASREALAQADGITNRVVDALWVESDRFWHDGDYYRVVALNRVIVEADPGFVDAYQNAAYLLWSLGDAPGADAFLRLGVARNPARYELYTEMGQHLFRTRRFRDALPYLKKGAAYKNAPAPAWATLAHCYERVGRLDEAIATWRQVVKRFPTFPSGPSNLRRAETRKQNTAGAGRPG
jgi:tetratricopeptide (TPR) repeat protein